MCRPTTRRRIDPLSTGEQAPVADTASSSAERFWRTWPIVLVLLLLSSAAHAQGKAFSLELPAGSEQPVIGIPRLFEQKRVDLLLEAFAELRRRGVPFRGLIIGSRAGTRPAA